MQNLSPKPNRKPWLWIAAASVACCPCSVVFLAALGSMAPKDVDAPTKPAQVAREVVKPPYSVTGVDWQNDDGVAFVVGTVTNQTAKRWSYVQIAINIVDADGSVLGSTLANANNIGPGQKWKFRALATEARKGSTFSVGDVTYW